MTKTEAPNPWDPHRRKTLMRVMSEVSYNPANISSQLQEELAYFMVEQLKGNNSFVNDNF